MSIQAQIAAIAARGIQAIDEGKTLLPTLAPCHRTLFVAEVDGGTSLVPRFAASKPRTRFPAYNY
jgi:hypothetical protein